MIEIVGSEEKIAAFLPDLHRLMTSEPITIENVRDLQYSNNSRTAQEWYRR